MIHSLHSRPYDWLYSKRKNNKYFREFKDKFRKTECSGPINFKCFSHITVDFKSKLDRKRICSIACSAVTPKNRTTNNLV